MSPPSRAATAAVTRAAGPASFSSPLTALGREASSWPTCTPERKTCGAGFDGLFDGSAGGLDDGPSSPGSTRAMTGPMRPMGPPPVATPWNSRAQPEHRGEALSGRQPGRAPHPPTHDPIQVTADAAEGPNDP